eukprot:TRINITY_DN24717_c0_g1_i1.p1 TRINITY_DN24717_c0_g1~~TRINITY_DN24717_c0_g1_i1.p1  ORF type:complete len:996 (+),score=249.22 TRINITY_DN24717_c0_g1_i1:81-3068(+)
MQPPLTPADLPLLISLLDVQSQAAPSPDARRQAEQQLTQAQRREGFCEAAICITRRADLPEPLRILAASALRQAADMHWRQRNRSQWTGSPSSPSAGIAPAEKARIRVAMLDLIRDPGVSSAPHRRQVSMALGRMARYDVLEQAWPELLPALEALLRADTGSALRGAMALHFVLYDCATNRLGAGQQMYTDLCGAVAPLVAEMAAATGAAALGDPAAGELCCLAHKCMLRVLKGSLKLLLPAHRSYLADTSSFLARCCHARAEQGGGAAGPLLDRLLKKAMKAALTGYQQRTADFVASGALPAYLDLCIQAVRIAAPGSGVLPDSFLLQCLSLLLHAVLSSTGVEEGAAALREAFGDGRLAVFARMLLEQYLVLTPADEQRWRADPESFVFDQEAEDSDVSTKSKAEELFTALIEHDDLGAGFVPHLVAHVQQVLAADGSAVAPRALAGVYHAMGLGCYAMPNHLGEEVAATWVARALRDGTTAGGATDLVVRWRAVWAVGQWVNSVPVSARPEIYARLVGVLGAADCDLVLRLTALRSLQYYVEDPEFAVTGLLPVLEAFLSALFSLLSACSHPDLKENGVALVSMLVTYVGRARFAPHAARLMDILHLYWSVEEARPHSGQSSPVPGADDGPPDDCCGAEARVRESVINCLCNLVKVIGLVPAVHDYACRVVAHTIDPAAGREELRESGLNLWYHTVRHTAEPTPQLMALWAHMPGLLQRDFETFERALEIAQEYVLLGGEAWLQQTGTALFERLHEVLRTKRDKGLMIVCAILDDFLVLMPQHAAAAGPLLIHMLSAVAQNSEPEVVLVQFLVLFCRLILANRAVAEQLLGSIAAERAGGNPSGGSALLVQITDALIDASDSIAHAVQRKICAMALTSLLVPRNEELAARVDAIAAVVVSAAQSEEGDSEGTFSALLQDAVVGTREDLPDDAAEAPAVARRSALLAADPVATVPARAWFHQHLAQLRAAVGGGPFQNLLAAIQPVNRQPLGI